MIEWTENMHSVGKEYYRTYWLFSNHSF